jgi:hypothetical protein
MATVCVMRLVMMKFELLCTVKGKGGEMVRLRFWAAMVSLREARV